MPWDFDNPSQIEEFKTLATSKGMNPTEVDSFIGSRKTPTPKISINETGNIDPLIPEAMPQIAKTPVQQPVMETPKPETLETAPIEPIPTPSLEAPAPNLETPGFGMQDILPQEQQQGLQTFGEQLNTPKQTNDFGQPPSIPSLAGQEAPMGDQQKIPVPEGSPSKANFQGSVPQGYQFKAKGRDDLTGQCAWFSQQISKLPNGEDWTIGSAIQDKRNQLAGHVKNGNAFMKGYDKPEAGNSVVMDVGTKWGHVATVNEVMPDGKIKLTESNWNNDLKVTHDRIVDPNDPTIMGFMKTIPNTRRK